MEVGQKLYDVWRSYADKSGAATYGWDSLSQEFKGAWAGLAKQLMQPPEDLEQKVKAEIEDAIKDNT